MLFYKEKQWGKMPGEGWTGVWKAIIDALRGHQEAVLAACMVFAGSVLLAASVNPVFAFGLPVAIYAMYAIRMRFKEGHQERMAEHDVQRLERTTGIETANKARRALERRHKKDG